MSKLSWMAVILLLAGAAGAFAETGIGLSAGYPVYVLVDYGFEPEALFAGVVARWKPSLFLLDAGFAFLLGGGLTYGFLNAGLCIDLLFLRFALSAGLDFVHYGEPGWSYLDPGLNVRTSLDFKLGPVSLGVSAAVPVDVLIGFLRQEDVSSDLRVLACQPAVNLIYWFGRSSKSHRR
jgi:hypothetical protein